MLTVQGLAPNTTYYFRVGGLNHNQVANFVAGNSTSTLTSLLTGQSVTGIFVTSLRVNWNLFAGGSGANTATGYRLEVSTDPTFVPLAGSSVTLNVNLSTLTVSSLIPATTYYLRAGGLNWNNVPNFVTVPSTKTLATPTPGGLAGTAVGVSSITWAWGAVTGASDYRLYMATSPTTLVAATSGPNSYIETGLSTNTAYGRMVTAVICGAANPPPRAGATPTF